jgi:4-amino-4-deoxy-L-arabinose transferase-like glycosyltransferase
MSWRAAIGCLALLLPFWAVGLFGRQLWTPDEPREADIAVRMSLQADRSVPQLVNVPILEKPPLVYWVAGAAAAISSSSTPAVLRLANLGYALLATLAIMLLAQSAAGEIGAWTAALTGASFVLAYQVAIWLATDAALVAGVAVALLGSYRGLTASSGRDKLVWYLVMHLGLLLGFMAKGVIGWLLPGLAFATVLIVQRRLTELRRWEFWSGVLLQALVIVPWLLSVAHRPQGVDELRTLFWFNLIGRFTRLNAPPELNFSAGHRNSPGKYLLEAPVYLLPWTLLAVAALRRAWQRARLSAPGNFPWVFALAAILPATLLLSLAATARDIYYAPVLPAFALLIGLWAQELPSSADAFDRKMLRASIGLMLAFWLAIGVPLGVLGIAIGSQMTSTAALSLGLLCSAAGIFGLYRAQRSLHSARYTAALAALFGSFALLLLTASLIAFPFIDRSHDLPSIARQVDRDLGTRPLALYQPDETTRAFVDLALPARRDFVVIVDTPAKAKAVLAAQPSSGFLLLLPGHADGPISKWLRDHGVAKQRPVAPPASRLGSDLGLAIEHAYELPEGRRYILLSKAGLLSKNGT